MITKEEAIDVKLAELAKRDRTLEDRARELDHQRELLDDRKREHVRELERVSNLSAAQAKQILLKEVEDMARHDAARIVRQVEEEAKRDADRRVRNILSVCMGRLAAAHAAETTVSVVQLPVRRHEGEDHRPRGTQHPRAGGAHRRRLHRRRHPSRRRALGLRRGPPRDRPHDAGEAAGRRAHPSRPHRGDLLPVQVRAGGPHRGDGRAGRARGAAWRRWIPSWSSSSGACASARPTARTCSPTSSSARTWPR